ncbi:MAG: hypothetical protein ACOVQ4_01955 [Flectobacillus sp.]|uniref:hypothetical protein n=1 Tax=Flectobacillus sp. TaxID=50419 RepID=UPI003B9D713E
MFKQFIDKVDGADLYMITSFLIFMAFFILVSIYLFIMDKGYLNKMQNLPLEDTSTHELQDVISI